MLPGTQSPSLNRVCGPWLPHPSNQVWTQTEFSQALPWWQRQETLLSETLGTEPTAAVPKAGLKPGPQR